MKLHYYQFREIGGMIRHQWSQPIRALNVYRAWREYCSMHSLDVYSWKEAKHEYEVLKNE